MSSDDSDDEPLSVLAALKKGESELEILPIYSQTKGPSEKLNLKNKFDVSISIQPVLQNDPPVVERPTDVWLYLTDFNPTGPYTCLLCSEWFLSRNRIVVHYVIDHNKEYCGICRYLLPTKEAWWEHQKFHMPWKCSLCAENFENQIEWRIHLGKTHGLVHCRFCSLRLSDGEDYHSHLLQKHSVTKFDSINENLWDFESNGPNKFLCLLCSKILKVGKEFPDHYMLHHHFTLKCFTYLIAGIDLQFKVKGIDLTPQFIEAELKSYSSYGYVDFVKSLKFKEEAVTCEAPVVVDCEPDLSENYDTDDIKLSDEIRSYRGVQDFDVALTEVIVLQKSYSEYIHATLKELSLNTMPASSEITYTNFEPITRPINCCLCTEVFMKKSSFETHITKAHSVKTVPLYWCRVCAAAFDSISELESHCHQELGEFEGLWICQFCDEEFNGREATRRHLSEHLDVIEYDNCFSPHLGFKCKFCMILFWNETDRESHHVRVHFQQHPSDFYSCTLCDKIFGDKVFYTYHYMEEHNGDIPYLLKCCVCSIIMDNVDIMRSHFESEHPNARKTYCCLDDCQYRPFLLRKSLLMHLKTFHTGNPRASKPTICPTCGQEFATSKACSHHCALAHGPPRLSCMHCDVALHTTDEKKIHYLLRHPDNSQYQCRECDKSFQHKSSLYVHKQLHKPTTKDYTCEYCSKTFVKRDSYREHMLIHEAPRHACSFCPMRFVQRSNMLRHERRHTGERPYSCEFCPRTFSDKGACTSHARTHLKNTSFVCVYCGQAFAQKSKLTYHIRKHTGENLETCPLCSKIFTSAGSLREHMRVHQKQKMRKTVKCPLCKKMYSDTRDMLKHMRGAHTAGQFQCPLCNKSVGTSGSLREHVLTHSKRKAYQCKFCPKSYHGRKSINYHLEKRHGAKAPVSRDYYHHLSPKECELGLDDAVIDKIFNKNRKTNTDLLIGDFVTFNQGLQITNTKDMTDRATDDRNDQNSDERNEENQSEEENLEGQVRVKIEPDDMDDENMEVPPSNFVNVKIECVEEESNSDGE